MTDERLLTHHWEGTADVEAAGGVVLRGNATGPEVLVVHRVRYGDWSLPKGKLDPGEEHAAAAAREVAEETGVAATVGPELRQTIYPVPDGLKRVRWFLMSPVDGDPDQRPADREVDVARWVPVAEATPLLTYPTDAELLAEAVALRRQGGTS